MLRVCTGALTLTVQQRGAGTPNGTDPSCGGTFSPTSARGSQDSIPRRNSIGTTCGAKSKLPEVLYAVHRHHQAYGSALRVECIVLAAGTALTPLGGRCR